MLRIPVNGSGSPTSLDMAKRGLRSGIGSECRIPNGFKRISIRFRPDRRLANSGRPGSAPLPSSDRSENKSFGDNAQGCRLTILSCVAEWSRPECDAADSGRPRDQSGTEFDQITAGLGKHPGAAGIPCATGWFRPDCDATDDGRPHKRTAPGKPEPVGR